jgi:hypothetical protein
MKPRTPIYGLMAEFETPQQILSATRRARLAGYRDMDAYTPYPVEGLSAELGLPRTRVPFVVFVAGLVGAGAGFFMQWYAAAFDYPVNVGGRPLNSWPLFIPITFELAVLVGGLTAVIGMLALNGLPMPYHPLFNVPRFARVTQDGFFLAVEARDPRFDRRQTAAFLHGLGATEVSEVAR